MTGAVEFDYQAWGAVYPSLAAEITPQQARFYFDSATLYCDNSELSPVCDLTQRRLFLWMITAHIATLNSCKNLNSPLVGRISSAAEGAVSATASYNAEPGSEQWFSQTQYGAAFWAAARGFFRGFYVPGPVPVF